jgi:hypothetical protein
VTAVKRLLALQTEHPLPVLDGARFAQVLEELQLPAQALDTTPVDRVKLLYDGLSPGLHPLLRESVDSGQIVVGEVGLPSPRAYIERVAVDQSLIVMHSGLFEFLYRIARPLSAAVFRAAGEADQVGIERAELARVVSEIFWWQLQTGDNFGPSYPITAEQKQIANVLAHSAESFLLAHEFGHAAIALNGGVGIGGAPVTAAQEEVLADRLGLCMFLTAQAAVDTRPDPLWLSMVYAGAELALQVWDVMSKLGLAFVDGDHPPSRTRIEGLRATFCEQVESDEVSNELLRLPRLLEETFDEVARIINAGGGEHAPLFEQQGKELVQAIYASLEKCAATAVPDYMTFYNDAAGFMTQGYAHEVLTDVFDKVAAEFATLRTQIGSLDGAAPLQRFNRFKLLVGLSDQLPEPAKSLFRASLARLTN